MKNQLGGVKDWILRDSPAPVPPLERWAERLNISPLFADMLWKRGFRDVEDMDAFLSPHVRFLAPPSKWPGVDSAADIIAQAVKNGQKPVVWGDYDVDGITAAALVLDVFDFYNIEADSYLPDRLLEGYGLNIPVIEKLAAQDFGLLITVDCGISDVEAVRRAVELGMTVVITDHHLAPEILPPAHAICNPRLGDCPCADLAGVGMAFFLMNAVNTRLAGKSGARYDMRGVLDLVALGTLADVVRLSSQNRILAKNGLLKIAEAARPGIAALKSVSGLNSLAALTAGQVVFNIAPRINAAGRLGKAETALELLRAESREKAQALAATLDELNIRRKSEEERICKEAREAALRMVEDRMGLVLFGKDWHPGIIGIVASRIMDEFYRPVVVLCEDQGVIKGSGRSIPEFDLHGGLAGISEMLLGFGGHKQAAGMRIAPEMLEAFSRAFDNAVRASIGEEAVRARLTVEGELSFKEAGNLDFLNELNLLQPFGPGNAEPVFISPSLRVRGRRVLGLNKNLTIINLQEVASGITLPAKFWRRPEAIPESADKGLIRVAYSIHLDMYNGAAGINLRVKDWMPV